MTFTSIVLAASSFIKLDVADIGWQSYAFDIDYDLVQWGSITKAPIANNWIHLISKMSTSASLSNHMTFYRVA